jgi:hypothetical protein
MEYSIVNIDIIKANKSKFTTSKPYNKNIGQQLEEMERACANTKDNEEQNHQLQAISGGILGRWMIVWEGASNSTHRSATPASQ